MTWVRMQGGEFSEMAHGFGIGGILVSTIILLAPLLVALRRWSLPFATATAIGTLTGVGMVAIEGFHNGQVALSYVIGGLAADVLVKVLKPRADRPARYRAFAAAVPFVVWSSYFVILQVTLGIGWVVEFWAGSVVLASITGFGLATAMTLPTPQISQPTT
jgi:peptidoglycan/LPS O-acetylase OafA/YrhL